MDNERIPDSWAGQRIDLVTLDADPGFRKEVEGAVFYGVGVRHVRRILLRAVTDRGLLVESAGQEAEGMQFFLPWGSVLRITLSR